MTGQQARDKLRKLVEERLSGGSTDVAEKIRYELSHSPRTWHLPQPTVDFVNGTAILRGAVPHETGRADLERAAAAVTGDIAVDNHLAVSGTNGSTCNVQRWRAAPGGPPSDGGRDGRKGRGRGARCCAGAG